jgi:hypothetical protein
MDMSYATIHVFAQEIIMYREVLLKYMVSIKTQLNNHPIYSIDTKIDSSIFYNDLSFEEGDPTTITTFEDKAESRAEECIDQRNCTKNEMWNMSFDGAINREGVEASVWINPPKVGTKLCSYKLTFDFTNNMA